MMAASAAVGAAALRVLLVEDDEADADLIALTIKKSNEGAVVDVAVSGKQFTELLAGHQYDIVLADYRLPDWTGMKALRKLRHLGFDMPFIVVTGTLGDEHAVECVKAGASDYVLKENLARLPMAVNRAIKEKQARDESLRAQRALAESAERFQKLTHASFDAIGISQDGILHEVNRGYLELFGYQRAKDVVGRPVTDFVADESRAEVEQRVNSNIEGTYELVGKRKDGTKILLEATARSHAIAGRPARITALRDMTERRALEEQFRQAQKMEAVGRLAGGVAHDFNNLLTVITGFTDLLLADFGSDDPRRSDLQQVRLAADKAASLTRQLLAFSRQQVIEPRVVRLEDVVKQTQKLLVHLIGEDIDFATQFGPTPCVVVIDPGQLEQVIMNLVVNARDAMPTGGKLTIETACVDLDEDYAAVHWPATTGRYAMLAVSDTGIGMDEATQAKIFEPFFTTKEPGKGTGLGLSTVYGIVKQSGGFVWAYGEPGKGAVFKIYLPLSAEDPGPDRENHTQLAAPRGTEVVMLVEDSQAVRFIARRTLEQQGYEVIEASSGRDALELAGSHDRRVDLLLTDVVMPEMSGRVLAEKFAAYQPNAKVLYMSGYTDDAVIRHGVLRAKTPFLQKPFTPIALAIRVREVLDS